MPSAAKQALSAALCKATSKMYVSRTKLYPLTMHMCTEDNRSMQRIKWWTLHSVPCANVQLGIFTYLNGHFFALPPCLPASCTTFLITHDISRAHALGIRLYRRCRLFET